MTMTAVAPAKLRSASGPQWARRVFSFPVMLASTLVALMVITVRGRFSDPDMWWHLKTGEVIWTTHAIPTTDLFSYTTHNHAWLAHEWLSQALLYGVYRFGGYSGLMLWFCFMSAALLIAGYALCSIYSNNSKIAFLGAILLWLFSTIGLAIRPHIIGYLLFLIEMLIIHLGRTRHPRWFYLLPPLFALWINCHGSFFLGLVVAATFLVSAFFRFKAGLLIASAWEPRARKTLGRALVLSLAAVFINPAGLKQVLYPLDLMFRMPLNLASVQEWQPVVFAEARGLAVLLVLASLILLAIMRLKAIFLEELLLIAAATWLALNHQRMLVIFGILVVPILCRLLADSWRDYDPRQDILAANLVIIGASLAAAVWAFPSKQNLAGQINANNPVNAANFLRRNHIQGNLLNDYTYGGYLIWALPEYSDFIDGRTDIFEWTGVLADFDKWAMLQGDPRELLQKYKIDIILIAPASPMAQVLPLMPGWKAVFKDDQAVLFTRVPIAPQH